MAETVPTRNQGSGLSQENVLKTLESLGLSQLDAKIYIFLGKRGPQRAIDIERSLRIPKQTLYRIIKTLQGKGLVTATLERPAKFRSIPFERALDLFVKAKTEEVHRIEQNKQNLLSDWQSIAISEAGDQSARFTVIEGRNFIYPKLKQMIEETKGQLSVVSTVTGLVRADQFGLLDTAFDHISRTKTTLRFLTEISPENLKAIKPLLERIPKGSTFEGRTPELGLKLISRMLIRDNSEAAFFVSEDTDRAAKDIDDVCLWTNSKAIVNSFKAVFEDLWNNSTSIQRRIAEIETGKPAAKTYLLSNPEAAKKKHDEMIDSAEKEIIMMTSSAGLVEACHNIVHFDEKAAKGVSIKIMAPIIRDNWKAALQLSGRCKVRHVRASYLGTTVVDGKYLLQFKSAESGKEKRREQLSYENAFYTSDPEYVEKTGIMLDDLWKNASALPGVTVEQITKPPSPPIIPVPDEEYSVFRKETPYQKSIVRTAEELRNITEEYVLNKIINAKRVPVKDPERDPVRFYGSNASALVHPPSSFNLPEAFLVFYHCNKQSSYGAEDWFIISLWLETPKGQAYVPVALAGDNSKAMERRKLAFAGTPASKNTHVLRKDEIQIRVHGNSLFAGWTVPIPLFPPQYVLPPASLLFEAYSKLKTVVATSVLPSGAKVISEGNGFDTFVTFFHPSSKYVGPGTDGIMTRDLIVTVYPPATPKPNAINQ